MSDKKERWPAGRWSNFKEAVEKVTHDTLNLDDRFHDLLAGDLSKVDRSIEATKLMELSYKLRRIAEDLLR